MAFIACLLDTFVANAALIAHDSAADSAYASGWFSQGGGGTGWGGPWQFGVSDGGNFFAIASSKLNGDSNGDGDIDSAGGRAWAITTGFRQGVGDLAYAQRPLAGTLSVGQAILADFDNAAPINSASAPGQGEQEFRVDSNVFPKNDAPFRFVALVTSPDYLIIDATGTHHTGIALTNEGLHLQFVLTGSTGYAFTVTPIAAGGASTTFTGSIKAEPINEIAFWNVAGGTSLGNALYFNNIAVVPAPNGVAVPLPRAAFTGFAMIAGLVARTKVRTSRAS